MRVDHLVVAAETLAKGVAHVEAALGVPVPPAIGRHQDMGTMNRLLALGGEEYLEIIAIDPEAPAPAGPRWFGLDTFAGPPRLLAWVCASDDLARDLLPGAGAVRAFHRGAFRWRMAVPADGRLPCDGLQPGQIEWQGPHPAPRLPASGCRLAGLTLASARPHELGARLAGLHDPRLRIVSAAAGATLAARIETPAGLRALA